MVCVVSDELYELIAENACRRKFGGNRCWKWISSRGCEGGLEGDWTDIVLQYWEEKDGELLEWLENEDTTEWGGDRGQYIGY